MGLLDRLRRFRPSPGTVIACVALVVACTGTATAATLITSQQIKNNTVSTKDVRDNSLRGRDVKDGSLRAHDFRRGEVPDGAAGPAGPQGPQGIQGPQGAPGLAGLETVFDSSADNSESPKTVTVTCPAGKQAISAGYNIAGGKTGVPPGGLSDVVVDQISTFGDQAFVDAYEEDAHGGDWSIELIAVCARVAP